jgi:hypothetical protein
MQDPSVAVHRFKEFRPSSWWWLHLRHLPYVSPQLRRAALTAVCWSVLSPLTYDRMLQRLENRVTTPIMLNSVGWRCVRDTSTVTNFETSFGKGSTWSGAVLAHRRLPDICCVRRLPVSDELMTGAIVAASFVVVFSRLSEYRRVIHDSVAGGMCFGFAALYPNVKVATDDRAAASAKLPSLVLGYRSFLARF